MAVKTETEVIRDEFNSLLESDKLAIAEILEIDEMLAPLEKQALDGLKAMFGTELGEEAFRLGTNPDITSEQIEAFLKKTNELEHEQ